MKNNYKVEFYQAAEAERTRLFLDRPGLIELFTLDMLAKKAGEIVLADSGRLMPGNSAGEAEVFRKAAFRAINFEVFQQLGQSENPALLDWLRRYLTTGLGAICTDPDKIEEAVQDSLPRILNNLDSVREPQSFLVWALRIVRNSLKGYYRKETRSVKIGERLAFEGAATSPDPEEGYCLRELREILLHHINSLRPTKNTGLQQQILRDFYFKGEAIEFIARELGVPNQRVSHLLDEAHKRLRNDAALTRKLADWHDDRAVRSRSPSANSGP